MLLRESSKTCLMVLANRALLFCSILEHMVNGGHKISAITLMGTSPEVILSKVEWKIIFLIRVATSAERYCNEEQKWWSQPASRPPCTPNQQAIANYNKFIASYTQAVPSRTIWRGLWCPANLRAKRFRAPSRAVSFFSPEERRPRWEVEPSLRVRKDG